jgi:hypothetical protein
MADFNIRSESVDVEQIMKQIRSRIREKRGVDYTEDQIRELATVRLEKFLDPKNLRSDLLEQFRRSRPAVASEPPPVEPPFVFNDQTLFETHRGALRVIRRLLNPILKLFFNPNPLINVLHTQAQFNVDLMKREQRRKLEFDRSRDEWNALYYEVLHNLVLETTRSGIEIKNLRMRVEALTSRLDFSERRVRALEGVVQYRPEAVRRSERDRDQRASEEDMGIDEAAALPAGESGAAPQPGQPGDGAKRRRRRRRGRRGLVAPGIGAPPPSDEDSADNAEFPMESASEERAGVDDSTAAEPVEHERAPRESNWSATGEEPSATSDATSTAPNEPGRILSGDRVSSDTAPGDTPPTAEADQDRRPSGPLPDDDQQQ